MLAYFPVVHYIAILSGFVSTCFVYHILWTLTCIEDILALLCLGVSLHLQSYYLGIVQKQGHITVSRPYCKCFWVYCDQNIVRIDRKIIHIDYRIRFANVTETIILHYVARHQMFLGVAHVF